MESINTVKSNMFEGKKWVVVSYIIFIFFSGLSLVFVPNVLSYQYASEISIVLILIPVLYSLYTNLGFKRTFYIILVLALLTIGIEYTALTTSYPYGGFFYNNSMPGKINGVLPWNTGLSYLPFLFGAVGISYYFSKNTFYRIIISSLVLVTLDLVIDPGAVSIGMWDYDKPGIYYGVPFSNFVGWIVSGTFMSAIVIKLLNKFPKNKLITLTYSLGISMLLWSWICFLQKLWLPFFIGVFVIIYLSVIYSKHEKIY